MLLALISKYCSCTQHNTQIFESVQQYWMDQPELVEGDPMFCAYCAQMQFQAQPNRTKLSRIADADLGIPYSTIHNILKEPARMFPYKIPKVHQL